MTPPTPPPTTYDHKPAYDWARSMRDRADVLIENGGDGVPVFGTWALVEAYMAGRAAALAEEREACAKVADRAAQSWGQFPIDNGPGYDYKRAAEEIAGDIRHR